METEIIFTIEVHKFGNWRAANIKTNTETETKAWDSFDEYKKTATRPCRLVKTVRYVVETFEPQVELPSIAA